MVVGQTVKVVGDRWLTESQMRKLCPDCADKMKKLSIAKVNLTELVESAWGKLPKGWTQESVKKFWSSLTGDRKHKITQCIKRMEGKVDDPGAFCGSLASKVGYR